MTLSMILTHLALVVAALVFAILAGIPLGILCYFYPPPGGWCSGWWT